MSIFSLISDQIPNEVHRFLNDVFISALIAVFLILLGSLYWLPTLWNLTEASIIKLRSWYNYLFLILLLLTFFKAYFRYQGKHLNPVLLTFNLVFFVVSLFSYPFLVKEEAHLISKNKGTGQSLSRQLRPESVDVFPQQAHIVAYADVSRVDKSAAKRIENLKKKAKGKVLRSHKRASRLKMRCHNEDKSVFILVILGVIFLNVFLTHIQKP